MRLVNNRLTTKLRQLASPPQPFFLVRDCMMSGIFKKKKATKKKPVTVKAFFPTMTNSQGFGMHLCRYEQSVRDYVFVPKNYGQKARSEGKPMIYCSCCKLTPCITVEHWEDVFRVAYDEHTKQWEGMQQGKKKKSDLAIMKKLERFTVRLMGKYFGREYTKKIGIPECIMKDTNQYTHEWYIYE